MVKLRLVMDQALYAKLHRLHGSKHPYMQTSWALSIPQSAYSTQIGNSSKMLTYNQESLQRVSQYSAYRKEECIIKQYNIGEVKLLLPEADE